MAKKRVPKTNTDIASIDVIEHSTFSGAQRNADVGNYLKPIPIAGDTWSTDCSTVRALPRLGMNLSVYNNSAAVETVTVGLTSSVATLAPGVVDAEGNVGIPIPPNSYLQVACWDRQWVVTSDAAVIVMIIESDSNLTNTAD